MPANVRYPVLLWQNHAGWYTAAVIERAYSAGTGTTARAALEQLEDYLHWLAQQDGDLPEPDLLDPELATFHVSIRPEYVEDERRYPCPEPITLRVVGVTGKQAHGQRVCVLPTMGLRFFYDEAPDLSSLAQQYIHHHLEGMTPQQLGQHLPPLAVALEQVVVPLPRKSRAPTPSEALPNLNAVAEPVEKLHRQFGRAWEREKELADLVRRLSEDKANVLIVGASGSGKTTLLVEAARQIERRDADRPMRFWLTGASRLIAGMRYLGQWEERCEEIIAELAREGGVLCVDNLIELVRQGGAGPTSSIAAFLLPYLQRGELRMVGEATPAELDACQRLLPGFADVFQLLRLEPMSRSQALAVLQRLTVSLQQNSKIESAPNVPELVYHLFHRFAPYDAFPGRAAEFVERVFERAARDRSSAVTNDVVVAAFVRETGLPELFMRDALPLSYDDALAALCRRIVGQDEPCRVAAELVLTFKAGLNDPQRPIGVLLFCGPTGVGKTELARTISDYFFGHGETRDRLVRLDMSEYAVPGSADRLPMRPNGDPSALIERVRRQPFCVVLFDEIEKADAEVFDLLMGVFDEGRLTDRFGRTASFRSAVLILTSNLGAGKMSSFGFGPAQAVRYDREALAFFRPEFFNRIDAVVAFQPLPEEAIQAITRKELDEIARREGLVRTGITLTWTDRLVAHLARTGFDRRYGARPLQRTLERLIVAPLARFLLQQGGVANARVLAELTETGNVAFRREA
jgi:ATP-dependent Clp protease ATP-binding subunit ClpC